MTTITVTLNKTTASFSGVNAFAGTNVVAKDNAGTVLPGVILTGNETPPWTAVFTGATGPNLVQVTATDLDSKGNTIGTPATATETGTGGVQQTYPQTSGITLTVV